MDLFDDISRFKVEGPYQTVDNPKYLTKQKRAQELKQRIKQLEYLLRTNYYYTFPRNDARIKNSPMVNELASNLMGTPSYSVARDEMVTGVELPDNIKQRFETGWKNLFLNVIDDFARDLREDFVEQWPRFHAVNREMGEERTEEQAEAIAGEIFQVFERELLDRQLLNAERERIEATDFVETYPYTYGQLKAVLREFLDSYAFDRTDEESEQKQIQLMAFIKANADPKMREWYLEWKEEHMDDYVRVTEYENVRQLDNFIDSLAQGSKEKYIMREENIQNMYENLLKSRLLFERYRAVLEPEKFESLLSLDVLDEIPTEFLVRVLPNRYELLDNLENSVEAKEMEIEDEKFNQALLQIYMFSVAEENRIDYTLDDQKKLLFLPLSKPSEFALEQLTSKIYSLSQWLSPERWQSMRDMTVAYYNNSFDVNDYAYLSRDYDDLIKEYNRRMQELAETKRTIRANFVESRRSNDNRPVRMCVRVLDDDGQKLQNQQEIPLFDYDWYLNGELVQSNKAVASRENCLVIRPSARDGFDETMAGIYQCMVKLSGKSADFGLWTSEKAEVIVELHCKRCSDWFNPDTNRFGDCTWHDRPTDDELQAMFLYNSTAQIDQPTYRGLLDRFNETIAQFDSVQRLAEFNEWQENYPNLPLPIQSQYGPESIYRWLSKYTGTDERLRDNPREPLEERQIKSMLRVLEVAIEQLDSASAKRQKRDYSMVSNRNSIWSESGELAGLADPSMIVKTDIEPTLILEYNSPFYENISLLSFPLFNELLSVEDRRFVNDLFERFVEFARNYQLKTKNRPIPRQIIKEYDYPHAAIELETMIFNWKLMRMRPQKMLQEKRILDQQYRSINPQTVSAEDMFVDIKTRDEIQQRAIAAFERTGNSANNYSASNSVPESCTWQCCLQPFSTQGCWRDAHSSKTSQETPYTLDENFRPVTGSYHLYWGYDFDSIDKAIKNYHKLWLSTRNERYFEEMSRAIQVFNYLQSQVPRSLYELPDGRKAIFTWNDLVEQGIVDEITRNKPTFSTRVAPKPQVDFDAFVSVPSYAEEEPDRRSPEPFLAAESGNLQEEMEDMIELLEGNFNPLSSEEFIENEVQADKIDSSMQEAYEWELSSSDAF